MTGEIVVSLSRPPKLPDVGPDVRAAVAQFLNPEPFAGPRLRVLPADMRAKCIALADALDARDAPAQPETIRLWLRQLAASVVPQPGPAEFNARLSAVMFACGALPGWVWNDDTLRAAMLRFKFWPAVQEVHDILAEAAKPTRNMAKAARALGNAEPEPREAERAPPTPAEVEAVRAKVEECKRVIAAAAIPEAPRRPARDVTLSGAHLAEFRARAMARAGR